MAISSRIFHLIQPHKTDISYIEFFIIQLNIQKG